MLFRSPTDGQGPREAFCDTKVVTSAVLAIEKTDAPDPVTAGGQDYTYTIRVTNTGLSDAKSVVVVDDLPDATDPMGEDDEVGDDDPVAAGADGLVLVRARSIVRGKGLKALIAALKARRIRAAALDVFENEPALNPDFLALDNAVLTPHSAWYSEDSAWNVRQLIMLEVDRFLASLPPRHPVPR